jgi:shikimate O-hydroxycinnamoyltransferase
MTREWNLWKPKEVAVSHSFSREENLRPSCGHLASYPTQPENSPFVLIKFNMFESRGVTIGVCVTHRCLMHTQVWLVRVYIELEYIKLGCVWSKLSLKDLRSKTEDYCQYQYRWITPADTSRGRAAVIWNTLTMVAQAKHGRLRPSLLTHRFNTRGKIAMPVPDI